jgi:hypothetical protein
MIRTIPIGVLVTFITTSVLAAGMNFLIAFPPVPLANGERIVGLDVQFKSPVYVSKISNIPKDWEVQLKLDPPPFPKISSSCVHGVGALVTTQDLPVFEIEPHESSPAQITAEATLYVVNFSGEEKVREIRITLKGTKP